MIADVHARIELFDNALHDFFRPPVKTVRRNQKPPQSLMGAAVIVKGDPLGQGFCAFADAVELLTTKQLFLNLFV